MSEISVILCRPQLGVNVGACARIMANMGYSDLRIVSPRDENILTSSYETASHASHILDSAKIYNSLEEATDDLHFIAMTSARPRDIEKKECYLDELPNLIKPQYLKIGVVFGPERTGLTNQELGIADVLVQIRTSDQHKSYNLSHAAAIVLYQLFSFNNNDYHEQSSDLASKKEIYMFFKKLEAILDDSGYFQEINKKNGQLLNIKNILTRDYFTKQDVKTLYGLMNHLKKPQKTTR